MHFCLQNQFTFSKCIHKLDCVTVMRNERSFFKMRAKSISVQLFGDCYTALRMKTISSFNHRCAVLKQRSPVSISRVRSSQSAPEKRMSSQNTNLSRKSESSSLLERSKISPAMTRLGQNASLWTSVPLKVRSLVVSVT